MAGPSAFPDEQPAGVLPFEAPAAARRPLLTAFPDGAGAAPLRQAVDAAAGKSPEQAARVLRLQQRTGAPVPFIERNLDELERETQRAEFDPDKFRRESPALAAWMAANPKHAELAADDTANLSLLDRLFGALKRGGYGLLQQGSATALGANARAMQEADAIDARLSRGEAPAAIPDAADAAGYRWMSPEQRASYRHALGAAAAGQVGSIAERQAQREAIPMDPAVRSALGSKSFADFWFHFSEKPVEFILTVGAESLPQMAPGMAGALVAGPFGGLPAAAAAMGAGSFGVDYAASTLEALREEGVDLKNRDAVAEAVANRDLMARVGRKAFSHAAPVAAFDGASAALAGLRLVPAGKALGVGAAARSGANLGAQAVVQGTMGAAGEVAGQVATGAEELAAGEIMAEFFGEFATAPVEVGGMAIATTRQRYREKLRAAERQAFFEALGQGVNDSKTFQRIPEKLREFIAQATAGGPVENIHVPVEAWATYWQSQNVDPREAAAEVLGSTTLYEEALATGVDLAIPLADYATKIAPNAQANAAFAREIRLRPDEMNAREAEELDAAFEALSKSAGQQSESPGSDSAARVREDVIGQLTGAGFDRGTIEAYAGMYESTFRSMGERAGVDPFELYSRYGLRIGRPLPEVLRARDQVDSFDALIDRVRAGQVVPEREKFGPSLTDYLRSIGGVQDYQGELAGRDADKALKPFQRRLVRPDGLAIDKALEAAQAAGYFPPDERLDITDLIDAIDADLRGERRYSFANANDDKLRTDQMVASLADYLDQLGVDVTAMSNAEVKAAIERAQALERETDAQGFDQSRGHRTIQVDGVRRPDSNSNGQIIYPMSGGMQGLVNFWRWFGDSKVVDADGRPLVVYHGTNQDFATFDPEQSREGDGIVFVTPNQRVASDFAKYRTTWAGANVMPVYVKAEKVLEVQGNGRNIREVERDTKIDGMKYGEDVRAYAARMGYDAIAFRQVRDPVSPDIDPIDDVYALLPSAQIKSATGNAGTFDPLSGSILYQGESDRLAAVHNLSAENLLFADKMGGIAVPSIAVVRPGQGIEGFGEITLLGTRPMADPAAEPVHDSDVYSPTFPRAEYKKVASAKAQKVVNEFKPFEKLYDDRTTDLIWDSMVNRPNPQEIVDRLLRNDAAMALFIEQTGGTPPAPIMTATPLSYPFAGHPAIKAVVDKFGYREVLNARPDENADIWTALSDAVRKAIEDHAEERQAGEDRNERLVLVVRNGYLASMFDDEDGEGPLSFGPAHRLMRDFEKVGQQSVDRRATHDALVEAIEGRESEFKSWVEGKIVSQFGEPLLKLGRKLVPYTLDNIVEVMSGRIKNQEKTMSYGAGNARAANAREFKNLEEMRAAAQTQIKTEGEVAELRKETEKLLEAFRAEIIEFYTFKDWRGNVDTWAALDASMKALSQGRTPAKLRAALRRNDFDAYRVPDDLIERGVAAAKSLIETPVPYFEAKPQRAVTLDEFAAAVVPSGTPQEALDVLDRHGIAWTYYERGDFKSREEAIAHMQREHGSRLLFQDRTGKRGSISFGPERQFNIKLFERADLSTFIHESGHFYLEVFGDLVEEISLADPATWTEQQRQMVRDYGALLEWLGVSSRAEIGVEQHEQFARGIEAYMREGRAPSPELRSMFAKFRAWLTAIYRSLTQLRVELSDEVRGVMDRMLATDREIEAAQREAQIAPLFTDAARAGMTPEEFAAYSETVAQAGEQARTELATKLMRQMQREREAWWKAERESVLAEVAAEVYERREYVALAALSRGTLPDGSAYPEDIGQIKLDRQVLVEMYGKEFLKRLPRPYVYAAEGGVHPDFAAQMFGFASGDELVMAIANARPIKPLIEAEADARMRERYGDMMVDGTLAEAAQAAVNGESREAIVAAELKALNKGLAKSIIPDAATIREMARGRIAAMVVRDLRPGAYLMAAQRASREAMSLVDSDRTGAMRAKQRELLNLALYREALAAQERVEAMVDYARSFDKKGKRERIGKAGGDYLDQIDALLDRYEFKRVSLKVLERRKSLAAWIAEKERAGLPVDLPESLVEEQRRVNYRELTVEALAGLRDGIRHIEHLATLKNKLLKAARKRELDEVAAEIDVSVREHGKARKRQIETRLPTDNAARLVAGWFASHRKIASLVRQMDGFEDGGALWEYVIRPINEAGNEEAAMREQATIRLGELFGQYAGRDAADLYRKREVPGVGPLTKMGRLMVALNWGNEANRQRVMDGYGWTDAQARAILESLDERDWQFVQGVWDFINSYWPAIEAKEKRVTGVAPDKVQAAPFTVTVQTAAGPKQIEMAGGYFPIKYDDRQSMQASANLESEFADITKQASHVRASTRRGHTKARAEKVEMPIRLDFGVIFEHVGQVIHDLSHHEMLLDVSRILGHKGVQQAILDTHGDIVYRELKGALADVAFGEEVAGLPWERVVGHLRQGTSIAFMGWNLMTSLQQPLGLSQSLVRVGPKWVAKGLARMLRNTASLESTAAWVHERSEFMRLRHKTQQREINEIRNEVGLQTGRLSGWVDEVLRTTTLDHVTRQGVVDSYFWLIARAQRMADLPTWIGAYEKAAADPENLRADGSLDEDRLVALADQAVLDSQGGGQMKDLARVQRGGPLLKLWTNFYSYFNVTWNLAVESTRRTHWRNPVEVGRLAVDYLLLTAFPATAAALIKHALTGPDDMDDEELAKKLAAENAGYLLGLMVGTREIGAAALGFSGYEGPAGARFFAVAGKFGNQAAQGELDAGFWKSLNDTAGIVLHYPAGQVRRSVEGFNALVEGKTINPLALLLGAPKE